MKKEFLKIGVVVDNEFDNDVRVRNEVKVLSEFGHSVFVLCLDFGQNKHIDHSKFGLQVDRIKMSKFFYNKTKAAQITFPFYDNVWIKHLRTFISKYDLDVIHGHDLHMAKSIKIANKNHQVTTILDLHENYPFGVMNSNYSQSPLGKIVANPSKWKKKEGDFLKDINHVIVLSKEFGEKLCSEYAHLNANNFHVFANLPDTAYYDWEDAKRESSTNVVFLYFGRIAERRGIYTMMEAFLQCNPKENHIGMLLVGPVDNADKARFEKLLHACSQKGDVEYIPWIKDSELSAVMNKTDVCVCPLVKDPQHESGIANKVFQYMLYKKPVIVSNCRPQQNLIEKEHCGLVFESENVKALSESFIEISQNEALRNEMGKRGQKAVLEKYNLEKASQTLLNLYKQINLELSQ